MMHISRFAAPLGVRSPKPLGNILLAQKGAYLNSMRGDSSGKSDQVGALDEEAQFKKQLQEDGFEEEKFKLPRWLDESNRITNFLHNIEDDKKRLGNLKSVNKGIVHIKAIRKNLNEAQAFLPEVDVDRMLKALHDAEEAFYRFYFTRCSHSIDSSNLSVYFGPQGKEGQNLYEISGSKEVILAKVFKYFKDPLERCIFECDRCIVTLEQQSLIDEAKKFRYFSFCCKNVLRRLEEVLCAPLGTENYFNDFTSRIDDLDTVLDDGFIELLLMRGIIPVADFIEHAPKDCIEHAPKDFIEYLLHTGFLDDPTIEKTLKNWLSAQQEAEQSSRLGGHLEGEGSPGRLGVSATEKASSQHTASEKTKDSNLAEESRSRF